MRPLPHAVVEHLRLSILGRVRLKLYREITEHDNIEPPVAQSRRWLLRHMRTHWQSGVLFTHLLGTRETTRLDEADLPSTDRLREALAELERRPPAGPQFIEVALSEPLGGLASVGVLIYSEGIKPDGRVYVATFLEDQQFPEFIAGRVEARASVDHPEPAFGVLGHDRYDSYSQDTFSDSRLARLTARLLVQLGTNGARWRPLSPSESDVPQMPERLIPPADPHLTKLIQEVAGKRLSAYRTLVPIAKVVPFSMDFAVSYPKDIVRELSAELDEESLPPLLLYWGGSAFTMSDDYAHYLAYRAAGYSVIPATILGPYPDREWASMQQGHLELLPPLWIRRSPDYEDLPIEVKDWMLDARLTKPDPPLPDSVVSAFLMLAGAIDDAHLSERDFHEFLRDHPTVFAPFGAAVISEMRLGASYRVDLAIRHEAPDMGTLLIELEHPKDRIFNRSGRLRKKVVHAVQQVEDWLRWWREQPMDVPAGFRSDLTPSGLVVVGRERFLGAEDRKRLDHLNETRHVKVITYDVLLARLEALIVNLGEPPNAER